MSYSSYLSVQDCLSLVGGTNVDGGTTRVKTLKNVERREKQRGTVSLRGHNSTPFVPKAGLAARGRERERAMFAGVDKLGGGVVGNAVTDSHLAVITMGESAATAR